MIRISRIVAKDKIFNLLERKYISKIELKQHKQKFRNPVICRAYIYLNLDNDNEYFNSVMSNIKEWGINHNSNIAVTTANMAIMNGFIKESAFNDFNYPIPKRYKQLCEMYSQEWINLFNYGKI